MSSEIFQHEGIQEALLMTKLPGYTTTIDGLLGYGSYIVPKIWFGPFPFSDSDMNAELQIGHPIHGVLEREIQDTRIVLDPFGYLFVACNDFEKSYKIINNICSLIRFVSLIPARFVKREELDYCAFSFSKNLFTEWFQTGDCQFMRDSYNRPSPVVKSDFSPPFEYKVVPVDDINMVFNSIETFPNSFSSEMILFLEASSLFDNDDYRASFLLGWILLEELLKKKWSEYLKNNHKDQIDRDERRDMRKWSISKVLRVLQLTGMVNNSIASFLFAVIKKRNKIVHEGLKDSGQVTSTQSEILLIATKSLIKLFIERKNWIDLTKEDQTMVNRWKEFFPIG